MKITSVWFFVGYLTGCLSVEDLVRMQNAKCAALTFVSREEWQARPPFRVFPMLLPVSHVIIMHTHYDCNNLYTCTRKLQFIQNLHMDTRGWWDIAYSFLIGGDGRVYEGVGWKFAAEHTINYNTISIGVAFMGTFNNVTPPKGMIDACKNLISCGIAKGYLTPTVQVSGQRDATCSRSPGDRLYMIIKQWPNFTGGRLPLYYCDEKTATPRPTKVLIKNEKCTALKFVPREQWQARPPFRTSSMILPVSHVIIMHTHYECNNLYTCARRLQFIQNCHMDKYGWWDIAYSFLIGGDGRVYEGVGWKLVGEHTRNYNTISIGVAFMGTFNNVTPSKGMIDACKNLIDCGIAKGYLTPTAKVSGHRDATCTRSPGERLYEIIKRWPNFLGGRLPFYQCDAISSALRPTED